MTEKSFATAEVTTVAPSAKVLGVRSPKNAKGLAKASPAEDRLAAWQAAVSPLASLSRQLETLAPLKSILAAVEQSKIADICFSATRVADTFAVQQKHQQTEAARFAAQLAALDPTVLARTEAIERMRPSSAPAAQYLSELPERRALKSAVEQAVKWSTRYQDLTETIKRLQEPLSVSSARAFLESIAKSSASSEELALTTDSSQQAKTEEVREEVMHLVQSVTDSIAKSLTTQEAVNQIVQALQDTKEPLHKQILFAAFAPILIALIFSFVNPYVDFHTKRWLEGTPKQEANKQVKEAAREAVSDVRLLYDFRFVSAKVLAVKSRPKANALAIGELQFGQAVRVIEKKQDFTLIAWQSEDGEVQLRGWVFSRYLKRFS